MKLNLNTLYKVHAISALIFSLVILIFFTYNVLLFSGFLNNHSYSHLIYTASYLWWPYIPQSLLALIVFILGIKNEKASFIVGFALAIWVIPLSLSILATASMPTLSLGNVLLINDIMALVGIIFAILNIWCLLKIISTKGSSTHES